MRPTKILQNSGNSTTQVNSKNGLQKPIYRFDAPWIPKYKNGKIFQFYVSCIIGPEYSVKVCTIGTVINRSAYTTDYCQLEGSQGRQSQPMPIRWMAWESVLLGKFTSKSDVWSFAVTLWEILTFAREQPYEYLNDAKVIENIGHIYQDDQQYELLPIPLNCPREIYDLMCECWQRNESNRPNFREIHLFLQRKNLGFKPTIMTY